MPTLLVQSSPIFAHFWGWFLRCAQTYYFFSPTSRVWVGASQKFTNPSLGTSGPRRATLTVPTPHAWVSKFNSEGQKSRLCPKLRSNIKKHTKVPLTPTLLQWAQPSFACYLGWFPRCTQNKMVFAPPPGGGWGPSQNSKNPSLGTSGPWSANLRVPTPYLWGR